MPVVAISLRNSDIDALERIQSKGMFSNRSEIMRHALSSLLTEQAELESLSGPSTVVVTIMYQEADKDGVCKQVQHTHADLISAMMHSHTIDGSCVEVFVVNGDADAIKDFVKSFRTSRLVGRMYLNMIGSG